MEGSAISQEEKTRMLDLINPATEKRNLSNALETSEMTKFFHTMSL